MVAIKKFKDSEGNDSDWPAIFNLMNIWQLKSKDLGTVVQSQISANYGLKASLLN